MEKPKSCKLLMRIYYGVTFISTLVCRYCSKNPIPLLGRNLKALKTDLKEMPAHLFIAPLSIIIKGGVFHSVCHDSLFNVNEVFKIYTYTFLRQLTL